MKLKFKRLIPILILVFCLSLLMTSCGKSPLSEKKLAKILPSDIIEYYYNGELLESSVESLEIERRNTDGEYDQVDCAIELKDEYVDRLVYVSLNLTYYEKGGWQIDSWDTTQEGSCSAVNEPESAIEEEYINQLGYNNIERENGNFDQENGSYSSEYTVNDKYKYASFEGKLYYYAYLACSDPQPEHPAKAEWQGEVNSDEITTHWNVTGTWTATCEAVHSNGTHDRIKFNIKSLHDDGTITATGAYYYQAVVPGGNTYTGKEGKYKAKNGRYKIEGSSPADAKLVIEVYTEYPSGTFQFTPDDLDVIFYNDNFENMKRN